ncbi:DUF4214 domain-containing protein [Marivita sp. S2033]|uniref:DUF4214 domain-containing protein n=1 Tax=Marivita sp. S2033 TaxID=3373187 RepID=UPI003981E18D
MAFTITFDYRFDSTGFFDSPARRAALELAAAQWEGIIRDDFEEVPVGTRFEIRNPTSYATETVTLTNAVDDVIVFVGATALPGSTLALAGPDGTDAAGDVYAARVSSDFRGTGTVTDFEPWAGSITFDTTANWSFSLGNPAAGQSDFLSVAVHEIGHILGVGTSGAFDRWVSNTSFTGPNAKSVNNGQAIPITPDGGHVQNGFAGDSVSLDPSLIDGTRVLLSQYDKAILADIGYDIAGFSKQGIKPAIATLAGERIFGRDVADTIDGLGGNDSLQGGDGNDLLLGNMGNDVLFGQTGNDTLMGGAGDDYLGGGTGNDELRGGGGNDTFYGQGGTDTFVIGKGDGKNTISDFDVGSEIIRLIDSGFNSRAEVVSAITKIAGNVSRLTLEDGTNVDVFHDFQSGTPLREDNFELIDAVASGDKSIINGNAGPNRLQGGKNNEQISGNDGDDTLSGGGGDDTLSGGSGADVFDINPGDQKVTITDFDLSQDILDLLDFEQSQVENALENAQADGGVVLTFSDGTTVKIGGTNVTTQNFPTATVRANGNNNEPVGPMIILGEALVGNTLTARKGGVSDPDGINWGSESFQWLRDGSPIYGATGGTYDVTTTDIGTQISVQYIYMDNGGTRETVTSKPEPAVPSGVAPPSGGGSTGGTQNPGTNNPDNDSPNGPLNILGEALVGNTLTARPNSITDPDGINYGSATFQWLRDGEPISGATAQTYDVGLADRGTQISVQYSYLDGNGTRETVTSKPEPTVPGGTTTPPPTTGGGDGGTPTEPTGPTEPEVPEPPAGHVNSVPIGKLVILGFPVEGADLLARTDAVFDRDGYDEAGSSFQWLRDGEPISGATGKLYTITADDRGAALSVQLTFTDGAGTVETVLSAEEPAVPFPDGEGPLVEDDSETSDDSVTDGVLEGTSDADTLVATAGVEQINGLDGEDTAVFAGDQSNYVLRLSPDGVTVTDRSDGGLGTIGLDGVELIDFGTEIGAFDGPVDLQRFGGHTDLGEEAFENFIEMYIAYFNRAPDAVGLSFWGTAYANGTSLEEIAEQFALQDETAATYPDDTSNIKFTAQVYENVLGRSPDIEGLRFWTGALDSGEVTRGEFILQVLRGVDAEAPEGASQAFLDRQAADQLYLEQKTDLGAFFAVHKGMSNVEDAAQVLALFDGSADSLATAVEAIETLHTAAMDPVNGDFLMPLVGVLDDPFTI